MKEWRCREQAPCGIRTTARGGDPSEPLEDAVAPRPSTVRGIQSSRSPEIAGEVCSAFWYPLYLRARRRGHPHEDACDLTQSFFLIALQQGYLEKYDSGKAGLSTFVHLLFARFLSKEERKARSTKHGGGWMAVSLDAVETHRTLDRALWNVDTPDRVSELACVRELVVRVLREGNRNPTGRSGQPTGWLIDAVQSGRRPALGPHALPRQRSAGAARAAACRARRRLRRQMRQVLMAEFACGDNVDIEVRHLWALFDR